MEIWVVVLIAVIIIAALVAIIWVLLRTPEEPGGGGRRYYPDPAISYANDPVPDTIYNGASYVVGNFADNVSWHDSMRNVVEITDTGRFLNIFFTEGFSGNRMRVPGQNPEWKPTGEQKADFHLGIYMATVTQRQLRVEAENPPKGANYGYNLPYPMFCNCNLVNRNLNSRSRNMFGREASWTFDNPFMARTATTIEPAPNGWYTAVSCTRDCKNTNVIREAMTLREGRISRLQTYYYVHDNFVPWFADFPGWQAVSPVREWTSSTGRSNVEVFLYWFGVEQDIPVGKGINWPRVHW